MIVIMGSGVETAVETAAFLVAQGEKVGVIQMTLYRPFPAEDFLAALPATAQEHRRSRPDKGDRCDRASRFIRM